MSEFPRLRAESAFFDSGEISVLHVDDDTAFTELASSFLERADQPFDVETAESAEAGLERLEAAEFDCIVSDYDMAGRNGIEFLRVVRRRHAELPFILYTGKGSEEVASEAISAGVTDYLQKETGTSQYTVLANRIRNAVERSRVRSQLLDRERHLRLFFERSPLGVIEWDDQLTVVRANERAEQILGYDEGDLRGECWETIVPETSQDDVASVFEAFQQNAGGFHNVNENVRADGEQIVCEWHNRAVTDEDGEVVSLFSQFQDVTERRQQTRQLQTLVDNLPGMVYRCGNDPGWPMEQVAGEVESLTGYAAATLEGDEFQYGSEIVHEDDREAVWGSVQEALSEGRQFELSYRIVRADGEVRWVWERGKGVYDDGEPVAIEGFVTDMTEREQAQRELREEQEFTGQLFDALDDVFYLLDTDGALERWNEQLTALSGYDDEVIDGRSAVEFFRPAHRERVGDAIAEALEQGWATVRADVETADGEHVPVELTGTRVTDGDGHLVGLVGIGRELSDRTEYERSLEETNTLLSTLVDALPVGVLAKDADGAVTTVNAKMLDLFDINETPESIRGTDGVGLREAALDALEEPDSFVRRVEEIRAAGDPVSGEHVRLEDGRVVERTFRAIDLPDGAGDLWVFQDVTERVATEEKLTALHDVAAELTAADSVEAVCQLTIEASEEILDFDLSAIDIVRDGRLEKVTTSSGTPPEGARTMSIDEGIVGKTYRTGESYRFDDIRTVEEASPQGPYRAAISIPIGEQGVFQAVAREPGVFDEADLELAELLGAHAANALVRIERERALERRNEQLDDLATIVSHDLRSPLNVAQGRIRLAREETGNEHLAPAARAVDRSLELVGEVLSLARQTDAGDRVPVDLAEVAESCWDVVETADATLDVRTEQEILANRSQLRQLLENLFRNSVEHGSTGRRTQSGDAVEHDSTRDRESGVTITVGDLPSVSASRASGGSEDEQRESSGGFYVADDGVGIADGDPEALFQPGYTGSESGIGLGLSIVRRVADAHGWEVTVTESGGGGARFEVTGVDTV